MQTQPTQPVSFYQHGFNYARATLKSEVPLPLPCKPTTQAEQADFHRGFTAGGITVQAAGNLTQNVKICIAIRYNTLSGGLGDYWKKWWVEFAKKNNITKAVRAYGEANPKSTYVLSVKTQVESVFAFISESPEGILDVQRIRKEMQEMYDSKVHIYTERERIRKEKKEFKKKTRVKDVNAEVLGNFFGTAPASAPTPTPVAVNVAPVVATVVPKVTLPDGMVLEGMSADDMTKIIQSTYCVTK